MCGYRFHLYQGFVFGYRLKGKWKAKQCYVVFLFFNCSDISQVNQHCKKNYNDEFVTITFEFQNTSKI